MNILQNIKKIFRNRSISYRQKLEEESLAHFEYLNEMFTKVTLEDYRNHLKWLVDEYNLYVQELRSNSLQLHNKLSGLLGWHLAFIGLLLTALAQKKEEMEPSIGIITIIIVTIGIFLIIILILLTIGIFLTKKYLPASLCCTNYRIIFEGINSCMMKDVEDKILVEKVLHLHIKTESTVRQNNRISKHVYGAYILLCITVIGIILLYLFLFLQPLLQGIFSAWDLAFLLYSKV